MKFMVQWSYPPEKLEAVIKKWESEHRKSREKKGAKLLGKWHGVSTNCGFQLYEVDDPLALSDVLAPFQGLMEHKVTLVFADEDIPRDYTVPR